MVRGLVPVGLLVIALLFAPTAAADDEDDTPPMPSVRIMDVTEDRKVAEGCLWMADLGYYDYEIYTATAWYSVGYYDNDGEWNEDFGTPGVWYVTHGQYVPSCPD